MTKESRTNLLVLVATVVATLFGLEFALRAVAPQPVYSALKSAVPDFFTASTFNTFTMRRNYVGTERSQEFPDKSVTVTTNSLGYRSPEINPVQKEKKRILILGDSYTFGAYVENSETYSAVLQKLLAEHGYDYEVINAGYANGFEADEQYCWLINEGLSLQPDVVIYGMFLGNDIMGIDKSSWVAVDQFELPNRIKSEKLYVDAEGIIRNKEADYKTVASDLIYRVPIARESHSLVLFGRVLTKITSVVASGTFSGYRFDDYPHIINLKGRANQPRRAEFEQKQLQLIKIVQGMQARAAASNAKFLTLMLPFNFMVEPDVFVPKLFGVATDQVEFNDYYGKLAAQLNSMKISNLNIFSEMKSNSQSKYFPRNGEVHFNPQGHAFTAAKLYEFLTSRDLIQR